MIEKIKKSLRISHDALDDDISASIAAARLELVRAGVKTEMAESETDELIYLAISTFCKSIYSPLLQDRQAYDESFKYQMDNLRKSKTYKAVLDERDH